MAQGASHELERAAGLPPAEPGAPLIQPWRRVTLDPEYSGAWVVAGDLDGDGAPDLVLAHSGGASARVLLNVTAPYCVGDCNANGAVTIEELMRGVNIVLGESDPRDCIALDADGSLTVTVNELVAAVNGSLEGCPTN